MIFSKEKRTLSSPLYFDGIRLQLVDNYKYLGFEIFFNGNLKHSAKALCDKSVKALFSLRSKLNNFENIPIKIQIKLFDILIKPIATYGAEVWICDFNVYRPDFLPFERLHKKFCKNVLGVHKNASNFACRWELGRRRILEHITSIAFRYKDRLSKLPHSRLLHEAYQTDLELKNTGSKCWMDFLHNSAAKMGLDINNSDVNYLITKLQKYNSNSLDDDILKFQNNPDNKLSFFSHICGKFELQPYLLFNEAKNLAKELTK